MNKEIKLHELIEKAKNELSKPEYFRFRVYQKNSDASNEKSKTKTVGMAYLRQGDEKYNLNLFTFVDDRFFLLPVNNMPGTYRILTAVENKSPHKKRKYIWNVIGTGKADTTAGEIQLKFDLFDSPVYVSLFPERYESGVKIREPNFLNDAA